MRVTTAHFGVATVGAAPLTGELHAGATVVKTRDGSALVVTRQHLTHDAARAELAATLAQLGFELVTN